MRKHRFYIENLDINVGDLVLLNEKDAHHSRDVLRLGVGDEVYVFNGEFEFLAEIKKITKKECEVFLKGISGENNIKTELTIFIPLIKYSNFEFALEKITEIGVSKIVPVEFNFSVIKAKDALNKNTRWLRIIESASKQSGRLDVPKLELPVKFKDIFYLENNKMVVFIEPEKDNSVSDFNIVNFTKDSYNSILVGPEGGFSKDEIALLNLNKISKFTLPLPTLRSETAIIISTALIKLSLG